MLDKQGSASELILQTILNNISESIILLDKEGNILWFNNNTEEVVFKNVNKKLQIGESIYSYVENSRIDEVKTIISRVLGGETIEYDKNYKRDSGEAVWYKFIYNPVYENNIINGLCITGRDITDNKLAEFKIIASEAKYRTLIESVQEGVWEVDENNTVVFVNKYMASLLGYTPGEMIGKNAFLFIDETVKPRALKNLDQRHKGISSQSELIFLNKNRHSIHTFVHSTPLFNNDKYAGTLAMVLDITQRKKAEEQIVSNEKRYRTLIENSTSGLTLIALNGLVKEMSPSGKRILGYGSEEIVGNVRLDLIHPDDIELVNKAFRDVIEDANNSKLFEYRHKMPDGNYKWLEGSFSNLLDKPFVNAVVLNYRDITERKRTEQILVQSEERYRQSQRIGKMGHWELDLLTNKLYWSDEIYNLFGIPLHSIEPDYERFINFIHPDDREYVAKKLEDALAGTGYDVVHKIIVNNATRYMHESAEVIKNKSGLPIKLSGFVQDVTETYSAYEESRIKARLLNTIGQAVIATDLKGIISYWNLAAENIYGWKATDALGKNVFEVFPLMEDEKQIAVEVKEHLSQGKTWSGEVLVQREDKIIIPVYVTNTPVYDKHNKVVGIIGVSMDISEQKKLSAQRESLLNIIQKSLNEIYMFSANTLKFFYLNEGALRNIGYTLEQMVEMTPLDIKPGFTLSQFKNHIAPLLNGEIEKIAFETKHKRADGTVYPVEVNLQLTDYLGDSVFLAIIMDITNRKNDEIELIKANHELRVLSSHLVNIREDERKHISREIHDELGQQLTAIKMDLSWLAKKLLMENKDHTVILSEMVYLIDNSIKTVRKIASDLRPPILDDLGLMEAIKWQVSEFIKHNGIAVNFTSNIKDIQLPSHVSITVFRILQEALTNITRHASASIVNCELKNPDGHLILKIEDNGVGMDLHKKDKTRTLGLLGMKERINMVNGKFEIISTPGEGTAIVITIPLPNANQSQ